MSEMGPSVKCIFEKSHPKAEAIRHLFYISLERLVADKAAQRDPYECL